MKNFSLHFWMNWTILHNLKKVCKKGMLDPPPLRYVFLHTIFFFLTLYPSLCIHHQDSSHDIAIPAVGQTHLLHWYFSSFGFPRQTSHLWSTRTHLEEQILKYYILLKFIYHGCIWGFNVSGKIKTFILSVKSMEMIRCFSDGFLTWSQNKIRKI